MTTRFQDKLAALEDGTLNPADFSHLDHVGVAVEALSKYDFFDAVSRYADGLRVLTEKAGVPEKFNATVTFASMSLIAERMHTHDHRDAEELLEANAKLFTKGFLTDQYVGDRSTSDLARKIPLMPADQFGQG